MLGRDEEALAMRRDIYSGRLKLSGDEHLTTLIAANNYSSTLLDLQSYEEAKALLRKMTPVARRVVGEGNDITLRMRLNYAGALCGDDRATLNDLSEAVATLTDTERIARRVLGSAHPLFGMIERDLRKSRAALRAQLRFGFSGGDGCCILDTS